MHPTLSLVVSAFLLASSSAQTPLTQHHPGLPVQAAPLVRVVLINMSGSNREAHALNQAITLPVAQRVALQVPAGTAITVTSNTSQHVSQVIVALASNEGHLYPIR